MSYFELVKSQIFKLSFLATIFYCTMVIRYAWDGYCYYIDWEYLARYSLIFIFAGAGIYWLYPDMRFRDFYLK